MTCSSPSQKAGACNATDVNRSATANMRTRQPRQDSLLDLLRGVPLHSRTTPSFSKGSMRQVHITRSELCSILDQALAIVSEVDDINRPTR